MLKIVIISGSIRIGRYTPKVAEFIKNQLLYNSLISDVKILDISEYKFPVMVERINRNPNPPSRLQEFSDILNSANAIIFISPEYNGSFSGALKNTIDYFKKEFRRKPIGVVTLSTGAYGGINAYHDLQKLVLSLGAYAVPKKLLFSNVSELFDENPEELETMHKQTVSFIEELLLLTEALFKMNNAGENKYYYN